jgi:hypothetical protein
MGGLRGLPKLPKRLGSEKTFGVGPFYSYKPGKPVYVYCLLLSAGNRPAAPWALVEWGDKYLKKIKHCLRVPRPFILVPHSTFGTESQPAISFFSLAQGNKSRRLHSIVHVHQPRLALPFLRTRLSRESGGPARHTIVGPQTFTAQWCESACRKCRLNKKNVNEGFPLICRPSNSVQHKRETLIRSTRRIYTDAPGSLLGRYRISRTLVKGLAGPLW